MYIAPKVLWQRNWSKWHLRKQRFIPLTIRFLDLKTLLWAKHHHPSHISDTFPDDVPSLDPIVPSDVEDRDYNETDSKSLDSDPSSSLDSDSQNSMISLIDSKSEDDHDHDADGSGMEVDGDNRIQGQPENEDLKHEYEPTISGLVVSIANIENNVIHMTQLSMAGLNLFFIAPPQISDFPLMKDFRKQALTSVLDMQLHSYQPQMHTALSSAKNLIMFNNNWNMQQKRRSRV